MQRFLLLTFTLCTLLANIASAAEIKVAVAANFHGTLQKLSPLYTAEHGHTLLISSGSTGALYTQIVNGAPFDVFLAADSKRPAKLEAEGYTLADSGFIYAYGVPVLWSASAGVIDAEGKVLKNGTFRYLAIAEPRNAPYGAAAQEVLSKLGLWAKLEKERRIVRGNSVGQAHSQVTTGAAELGFVALAQVKTAEGIAGSYWIPPANLYAPIEQAAVALKRADDVAAVRDFLNWLRTDARAHEIIKAAGYGSK